MRRLTDKELQDKRARGLCFRCDEKWSIGHRCKRRELSVLLIEKEEDEGTEFIGSDPPMSPTEEALTEVTIHLEVSLNSVIGLSNPRIMKLKGVLRGREVVVMIDTGATQNFILLALVEELGMQLDGNGNFGVFLGNGDTIHGKGVCKNVEIVLTGNVEITVDMLPLELGTSDIILGVQWLET